MRAVSRIGSPFPIGWLRQSWLAIMFTCSICAAQIKPMSAHELNKLTSQAENGSLRAQVRLAKLYESGQTGTIDYEQAARWLRRAADQGDPDSQNSLALHYLMGRGVPRDESEAERWLQRATASGSLFAMHNLATMYLDRSGVNPDPARGIELLTRAANLGFEVSQLRLGLAYLSGESVPRDPQLGLAWVKRAAKHHLAGAEFVLGSAYENGFGTKPNLARAAELYRDSAAQGSPAAQNNLGRLYLEGRGVTKNTRESVRLFRASAEHGNAQSYFNLALCSLTACDGVQDVTAAYAWYLSGARFIQPPPADFQAQFSHLAAQLTPDQIRDAESISQAWIAKHPAADPHEPLQLNHVPGMTTIIAGNSRIDTFPNEVVNRLWLQTQFTQAPSLNPASEH